MPQKVDVLPAASLPPGDWKAVRVGQRELAVFNVDGRFYTLNNSCPHVGGPLAMGRFEGHEVTCPLHAWRFDVRSGRCLNQPRDAISYPTTVVDGMVQAELPDD